MRGFLASSIGVTCAAALALPLTPPAVAATGRPVPGAEAATSAALTAGPAARRENAGPSAAGSTQSLPLTPLTRDRAADGPAEQGLSRRTVRPFSLVGVVWDDPAAELHGRVQVRTRDAATGVWSGWQDVETHNADHGADPDTAEGAPGRLRGSTAPLWVGASNGVELRVTPEGGNPEPDKPATTGEGAPGKTPASGDSTKPEKTPATGDGKKQEKTSTTGEAAKPEKTPATADGTKPGKTPTTGEGAKPEKTPATADAPAPTPTPAPASAPAATTALPTGLRLELVDPGEAAAPEDETLAAARPGALQPETAEAVAASTANAELAAAGATEIPALGKAETERELLTLRGGELTAAQKAKPYIGPRPSIVTRRGWGANERWRESRFVYTSKVKAAFVHHTATGNKYTCAQAPSVIRGIYRYHVVSMGWRDIGYNFLVDKCGRIYEGRAGGVAKAVLGAHTLGFNTNSMGIAVLGTYGSKKPSASAVKAVARLTAWKLGLYGANPRGKTYLTSGGGNLYRKGKNVRLNVISGHRDGFSTECPGLQLYRKLGSTRTTSARYQGR
ncbi:N-acetylmuramoyl-L-alanine amidase [Streptomyces sp. KAU_LT]|uniref:N-acetylmuramoyl-L-alanine amidase n=1 Tax=Streptomyces sp. KAU_LT TaxID=3046669 RepID=UPI0024B65E93|nr:N-acetylmuramoyl-L-alanine amidase [Streptomyces sp. KAU_LT]MDI9829612.1 N-acetylmuramoyl-L-alanine amidase [Streptomyces sp. KAU_LT]